MKKIGTYITLAVMAVLNVTGCAFLGIDLTDDRTIAISKPPYTVALDGDIEAKDLKMTYQILEFLATQKTEGTYNPNIVVHITDQTTITKGTNISDVTKSTTITTDPQSVMD